jgi:DNA-binding GntR family transcriptional regulator
MKILTSSKDVSSLRPSKSRGKPKGEGSQTIYEALRRDILSAELAPGTDIDELSLVARYGVSRTPIREALIRLASERLVTIVPNRGARVASLEISDIPALLEALELCERAINRFSALRRGDEELKAIKLHCDGFEEASLRLNYNLMAEENRNFHHAIACSCGNRYLREQYESLSMMTVRLARIAFATWGSPEQGEAYYKTVCRQHRDMLHAIERFDANAADELARAHAKVFRGRMFTFIERSNAADLELEESPEAKFA